MPRLPYRAARGLIVLAGVAMTQGCAGGTPSSSYDPPVTPVMEDDGGPSEAGASTQEAAAYPAVAPSVPAVESAGGKVLSTPRIVPVFFPGETQAAMLTDAIGKYVVSAEWRAATAQYGVGGTTAAAPVSSTDALTSSLTTEDLGTWLADHLDGTHPGWGPTDEATLSMSQRRGPQSVTAVGSEGSSSGA